MLSNMNTFNNFSPENIIKNVNGLKNEINEIRQTMRY